MTKPRPDFGGMIDLPDDPGEAVQSDLHTPIQSYDRTPVRHPPERRRAPSRAKAQAEADERRGDYVQRSLYAREDTFERIREFAFKNRRPAQELYREGLFLVLKKYGLAAGLSKPEDV